MVRSMTACLKNQHYVNGITFCCLFGKQPGPLGPWQSLNACGIEPGKPFPEHPYSCKASLRFFLNECLSHKTALSLPGACPPGTSPAAPVQSGLIPFDAVVPSTAEAAVSALSLCTGLNSLTLPDSAQFSDLSVLFLALASHCKPGKKEPATAMLQAGCYADVNAPPPTSIIFFF